VLEVKMEEIYNLIERRIENTDLQNTMKDIADLAYSRGKREQMDNELEYLLEYLKEKLCAR